MTHIAARVAEGRYKGHPAGSDRTFTFGSLMVSVRSNDLFGYGRPWQTWSSDLSTKLYAWRGR
jgi:hypothetical protein